MDDKVQRRRWRMSRLAAPQAPPPPSSAVMTPQARSEVRPPETYPWAVAVPAAAALTFLALRRRRKRRGDIR